MRAWACCALQVGEGEGEPAKSDADRMAARRAGPTGNGPWGKRPRLGVAVNRELDQDSSVSLQRDSPRTFAVPRREVRVEGEGSELATTRRRQRVRRAASTRSNLRRGALAPGKRPSAAARRGGPRLRVAESDADAGADGGEPRAIGSGDDVRRCLTAGPWQSWVEGVRGRSSAWGGGRRETGASCHKREKVEGMWRMLDRTSMD
jgi:hypothetical protein